MCDGNFCWGVLEAKGATNISYNKSKIQDFIALSCNAAIIYDHIPICEVIHLKIIPLDTDRMKKQKSFSLVFEIFLSSNKIIHV